MRANMRATLLIENANQIVTSNRSRFEFFKTKGMGELLVQENGAVAVNGEQIIAVGSTEAVRAQIEMTPTTQILDARGKTITPGLVDPHTHPVFFGTREHEFELRVQGKSYQEIAQAGGGIRSSVRSLRQASQSELVAAVLPRMQTFLENGTTTIEAKSGYGLSLEDEIKSLKVIQEVNRRQPVDLVATFLGAHEVPDEYRGHRDAYIQLVTQKMLPAVAKEGLAEFCDIFCEEGVFSPDEARVILSAGKKLGLRPKIHANQLSASGGVQVAAEVGAISAEHLDHVTAEEIECLRAAGVIPVLLPSAVFYLNLERFAPARAMIAAGLPIALSTDYNPGTSFTESMPLVMTLACIKLHITPAEALIAATMNAAMAIDREHQIGSLEPGKLADIVIWNVPNYLHLAYHFGVALAETVVKRGIVVYKKSPLLFD
jgi:imidazolonepropionase